MPKGINILVLPYMLVVWIFDPHDQTLTDLDIRTADYQILHVITIGFGN